MTNLARELERTHGTRHCDYLTPKNCQPVHLPFRGDKLATVVGSLAQQPPEQGAPLSGLLVKKDFKYKLLAASDLPDSTPLRATTLVQRPSFRYTVRCSAHLRVAHELAAISPRREVT